MAEKVLVNRTTLTAIADSIRAKLESSNQMLPSEMAALIDAISTGVKMATGTFTVSDAFTPFYTVTHGLGEVPNIAIAIRLRGSDQTKPMAYFTIKDGTGRFITDNVGALSNGTASYDKPTYGLSEISWDASTVKFGGYSGVNGTYFRGDYMWLAGVI